jgi:nucleoside-diphosphate-sugar epimerase
MTHNSDFAKGFTGLMGNPHAIGEAVQITSDEVLTWNQIYKTIADILGKELKAVHISTEFLDACGPYEIVPGLLGDKANSVVFDNSKIKRLVPDFCATKRFDQGVREAIENILANPELQVPDAAFDSWCDRIIALREKAIKEFKGGN